LQSRIGEQLTMRRTPTLVFEYDESVERGVRLGALIDQAAAELPERTDDEEEAGDE
jgi:ribosome-binding factor A